MALIPDPFSIRWEWGIVFLGTISQGRSATAFPRRSDPGLIFATPQGLGARNGLVDSWIFGLADGGMGVTGGRGRMADGKWQMADGRPSFIRLEI